MEEISHIENIKDKIHTIREKQVLLDRDLAELYEVETRVLNQAVKRNIERFPERYMFQLTKKESENLRCQIVSSDLDHSLRSQVVTLEKQENLRGKHRKYLPYCFTEQGVAMLSTVLRSKKAIDVSILIMDAFVSMRKFLSQNAEVFQRIDSIEKRQIIFETKTEDNFEKVFKALETEKPKQGIFYNGQVFDAYKFICDLIRQAKTRIILIDNYVDETVLELFTKTEVRTTIYTKNILKLDYNKYKQQYMNIEIKTFSLSHDRFLIIDDDLYHIGASLKDLGKKWFGFSKFDKNSLKILERLENPSNNAQKSL